VRTLVFVSEAVESTGVCAKVIYKWVKRGHVYSESIVRVGRNGSRDVLLVDLDDILDRDRANKGLPVFEPEFEEWQLAVARKVYGNVED